MRREDWDRKYEGKDLLWTAVPNRFLAAEVEHLRPGRVLDLACGEGRNAVWLAELGWDVTGVDFSAVALAKARRLAAVRDVEVAWIEADLVGWTPPADAFDLVAVLYLQLPAEERRIVLGRAANALAPGGTLLVIGHDLSNLTDGWGGPTNPAVLFSPDDVVAEISGLAVERSGRVARPVVAEDGEHEAIDALVRARRPL